ncbi:peroxisomal membrane protein 2 [Selaginella moellendorffii]|nr:peroxisomal membrane protein 2 [Selaginella moellendorffii]|eukprot:XP_002967587.2 peroxisomal membrane protein 2 [Selaginella moellendorffii]
MAMVARCCAMRLASSRGLSSCSSPRSPIHSQPSRSALALCNRHSGGGLEQRRCDSSRNFAIGSFSRSAARRPCMALGPKHPALEMGGIFKGVSTTQTIQQHSSVAGALPDENEEQGLISGGSLRSDDGAGGAGRGGSGGGGGGQGDHHSQSGGGGGGNPVLAWYMKLLEERPVTTKAVTAAILTFMGDLFTQLVIEKSGGIDIKRIVVITSLGLMLVGPTLHFWYLTLSKVVKIGGVKGTGIRLFLDQLFFSPLFIGVFFICLLTLEGRPSDIGPKLSRDWPSAVITNWKLWVPFQFINFMFVPQKLQVGFSNIIALVWNAYLSFATHTEVDSKSH